MNQSLLEAITKSKHENEWGGSLSLLTSKRKREEK